jgi:hypothetical protein
MVKKSEKSALQKAVDLMEENGFRVSRAYEENCGDVGSDHPHKEVPTGAIILRITPKEAVPHGTIETKDGKLIEY